jgi:hypothetical protein
MLSGLKEWKILKEDKDYTDVAFVVLALIVMTAAWYIALLGIHI